MEKIDKSETVRVCIVLPDQTVSCCSPDHRHRMEFTRRKRRAALHNPNVKNAQEGTPRHESEWRGGVRLPTRVTLPAVPGLPDNQGTPKTMPRQCQATVNAKPGKAIVYRILTRGPPSSRAPVPASAPPFHLYKGLPPL